MSFLRGPARPRFEIGADAPSPLDVAVYSADRETLAMVRAALGLRRMRLAFQPAVYAADPSIIGFYEGYIRILDPEDRVIPARAFMAVAETQELGREIDVAALQLGLMALQRHPGLRVAVNLSARSVGYKPWTDLLAQALASHPGIGKGLILEIGEESAMQMPDVLMPFMADMRKAHIAVTLDDFGAGVTSLSLLQALRFDIAKLDGRFTRGIDRDPTHRPLVRAAIAMAKEFNMFLVAEAVETTGEATWLRDQGVGCLQGYLFGAPEMAPDFSRFRRGRSAG
ncbi:EAL domain-containing protein [Xinfangfangia pollutisoli]|uniref:EAL domain-containing protein n=1 Tax=Xinfangfangia pollutisoli TaxID=2865960 RepID=UPI001CD2EF71|nr:EAL domain-containing protein [Xinfangfangia pollutisoli]